MGGCATKPRDLNGNPDPLPSENPTSPESTVKNVEGETAAQETGESQKEEPLVDLSEPKPEAPNSDGDASEEAKAAVVDLVSGLGEPSDATANQTEENVGAGDNTTEQIKYGPEEVADLAEQTSVETNNSDVAGQEQSLASETSENKGDSLLASN